MKTLKKRRRVQIILVAVVSLTLATGLIGYGMRDGINLYISPTKVAENPPAPSEIFKIGGLVVEGSIVRDQGKTIRFSVTDTNKSIPVAFTGILPDLFEEGQSMIGTGSYIDGVFVATEILAKHDEDYMPSEVVDMLEEQGVYQDANDS